MVKWLPGLFVAISFESQICLSVSTHISYPQKAKRKGFQFPFCKECCTAPRMKCAFHSADPFWNRLGEYYDTAVEMKEKMIRILSCFGVLL
jgi:hypothetical protein